jgi:hypothetical protein
VQKVKQETKMIVYPAKGQSAGQQAIDERECYVWSEQQTGIDPMVAGRMPTQRQRPRQIRWIRQPRGPL